MLHAVRVGLVQNLAALLPVQLLQEQGVLELVLLGRAATDPVCARTAEQSFSPLRVRRLPDVHVSAAFGAAAAALAHSSP